MKETVKCLHLSFDQAPVEVRERVSFAHGETAALVAFMGDRRFAREFVVLSTCNRTEVYYVSEADLKERFIELLCAFKNDPSLRQPAAQFVSETDANVAVMRLFRVSNGQLSQVLGDIQVIRQVKDAYDIAARAGVVGPHLHRLLQLVFASHKDVSTYTDIHAGHASVSSAAADMVQRLLKKDRDRSILVIGAGRFSREVIEQLIKKRYERITIANRNTGKAQSLAARLGLQQVPLQSLHGPLPYDVIISCVSAGRAVITKEQWAGSAGRPVLMIDLSVPRAIDPALQGVPGVKLVNMDEIEEHNREAVKKRQDSMPRVAKIIQAYCEEFREWQASSQVRPVLNDFKNAMEDIRLKEVRRHLKKYKDKGVNAELVETITKSIVNRIIKLPAVRLNETGSKSISELDSLSKALARLFDLKEMQEAAA